MAKYIERTDIVWQGDRGVARTIVEVEKKETSLADKAITGVVASIAMFAVKTAFTATTGIPTS